MSGDTFDRFQPRDRGRFGDNERAPAGGRVSGASDLHDVDVAFHHKTDRAILVSIDGNAARAVWLPKSQVEFELVAGRYVDGTNRDGFACQFALARVTLPERLGKEKRLL